MTTETMAETSSAGAPLAERLAAELDRLAETGDEGVVDEGVDWNEVASRFGLSLRQLSRVFTARHGTTPARYLADRRAERARELLQTGHDVLSAAVHAGYSGPGRLHDAIVMRIGMTPGEVRTGGKDVRIAFGVFSTPVGLALIARTPRGICAIRLCRDRGPSEQLNELRIQVATERQHLESLERQKEPMTSRLRELAELVWGPVSGTRRKNPEWTDWAGLRFAFQRVL